MQLLVKLSQPSTTWNFVKIKSNFANLFSDLFWNYSKDITDCLFKEDFEATRPNGSTRSEDHTQMALFLKQNENDSLRSNWSNFQDR